METQRKSGENKLRNRKFLPWLFGTLGAVLAAAALTVCLLWREAEPVVVRYPREAEQCVSAMMAALSSGDFQQAFIAQRLAPLKAGRSMAGVARGLIPTMVAPGYDGPGLAQAQACMGSITPTAYKAALGALVQFEQRATLPTITVPTLCIAGEHDRTAAPSVVQRMADKIPNAQCLCLPGVGHLLTFEQPERFADALLPFLQRSFA